MKIILMIGPQGSGKGTQSELLAFKLGLPHITVGTLFRTEIAKGSELGTKMKDYMDRGEIVPSDITDRVITERLSRKDAANGMILDGYPRTLEQADKLDNIMSTLGRTITDVVYLNITHAEAHHRLAGRRVCQNVACEQNYHLEMNPPTKKAGFCDKCGSVIAQRSDDTPDAIERRLHIYEVDTVPLIELYKGQGYLREMDAMKPIGDVQQHILTAIGA